MRAVAGGPRKKGHLMKSARLIATPATGVSTFEWAWSSEDGSRSKGTFAYYFDCVVDAEKHGCTVPGLWTNQRTQPLLWGAA